MLQSARFTLKQHRFEVGFGALAMVLVGAAALWVNSMLLAVNVPAGCFEAWFNAGPFGVGPECEGPVREFGEINESQAGKVFAAMAVLPLAAGLLVGVALVGRELEARTAQTAWALSASRLRWFIRQLWPVLLVLLITVTFAAFAASILETTRRTFSSYPFMDLGLFGPIVVARAFAALGIGLFVGAAVGRTLPAFVVGAVLSFVLVSRAASGPYEWASTQPRVILGETEQSSDAWVYQQGWRAPDGQILSDMDGYALAPSDESVAPDEWLRSQGYELIQIGLTAETARGWEPIEAAAFAGIGAVLILGTVFVIDRRRPS